MLKQFIIALLVISGLVAMPRVASASFVGRANTATVLGLATNLAQIRAAQSYSSQPYSSYARYGYSSPYYSSYSTGSYYGSYPYTANCGCYRTVSQYPYNYQSSYYGYPYTNYGYGYGSQYGYAGYGSYGYTPVYYAAYEPVLTSIYTSLNYRQSQNNYYYGGTTITGGPVNSYYGNRANLGRYPSNVNPVDMGTTSYTGRSNIDPVDIGVGYGADRTSIINPEDIGTDSYRSNIDPVDIGTSYDGKSNIDPVDIGIK